MVSRDERSKELKISVGYRSVDGADRGESVHGPVGRHYARVSVE
jgi:hypothetical protein